MSFAKINISTNWKKFEKALKQAGPSVRKRLRSSTALIGKNGEALARQQIRGGSLTRNAALTKALKGGKDEPLIGGRVGAPLFKSITSKVIDEMSVFIGVLQTESVYNIATVVHDGCNIPVTNKMRIMFKMLWLKETNPAITLSKRAQELWEAMPGGWKPLKDTTTTIVIPERPFIRNLWEKESIQKIAKRIWGETIQLIMKDLVK